MPSCLDSSAIYSNAVYMKLLDPGVKTIRFQFRDSLISLHVVYLVDIFILLDYCCVWDTGYLFNSGEAYLIVMS